MAVGEPLVAGEPLLALRDVEFRYPGAARPALSRVSLSIHAGEGVALLGPNGAGKTTLTRVTMALLRADAGEVLVAGRDARRLNPEDLAPHAGYLFQQPEAQLFERSVRAEVAFGPRRLGWSQHATEARVAELLPLLGLADAADEHPYDLPLPRRRLVALAAALAARPRLLLLDEPTAGLDRVGRAIVAEVVAAHLAAGGAALAVTHDSAFALECLPRAVVLDDGRVRDDGPTAALLGSQPDLPLPPHAAVARALGLAPRSLAVADVAAALAERCSPPGRTLS